MTPGPFHLALPVDDLDASTAFYVVGLRAEIVARDERWCVLDLFGHKLTLNATGAGRTAFEDLATRHFGLILGEGTFEAIAAGLASAGAEIVMPARLDHAGTRRAQWVLMARDPSGHGFELNAFPEGTWQAQIE
jgi:extradiol dioxygenase family protein